MFRKNGHMKNKHVIKMNGNQIEKNKRGFFTLSFFRKHKRQEQKQQIGIVDAP